MFDILESCEAIREYILGVSKKQFLVSREKQDAVIRRIAIIDEAIKQVPISFREQYPDIPWRKIAGMRDIVIHEYAGVDLVYTWETAKSGVPKFQRMIQQIVDQSQKEVPKGSKK